MEGFFKSVRDVNRLLQGFVEREGRRDILGSLRARAGSMRIGDDLWLIDGVIGPASSAAVPAMTPETVLRIYAASLDYQALPSTRLRDAMRRAVEGFTLDMVCTRPAAEAFREILASPRHAGPVVRHMHETGALGMMVPEFAALTCKVEYDAYHEFTIDEHCIMALQAFEALAADADSAVRACRRRIVRAGLLRASILLHDIGKAAPGDHTISGATIAAAVCRRLGFTEEETGRIAWLVQRHLDLANLALRREPEEPALARFAETIIDAECLDMLYLLTIVDIRSVGSKTWTAWKGMQLAKVYQRTAALIKCPHPKPAAGAAGVDLFSPDHARAFEDDAASVHRSSDLVIRIQSGPGFEELIMIAMDRPRLFADIVACISSEGYNILSARITTRSDDRILDVFHVESDGTTTVSPEERARNIAGKWDLLCRGAVAAETLIAQRRARYPAGARRETGAAGVSVIIDNSASDGCSVLEIEAPDRFGLLHRIAQTLGRFEVNIVSARILTRIDRAVDVFYITDGKGCKIDGAEKQQAITRLLQEALEGLA
jgi:[protein-PII] uridylyltransferase